VIALQHSDKGIQTFIRTETFVRVKSFRDLWCSTSTFWKILATRNREREKV